MIVAVREFRKGFTEHIAVQPETIARFMRWWIVTVMPRYDEHGNDNGHRSDICPNGFPMRLHVTPTTVAFGRKTEAVSV